MLWTWIIWIAIATGVLGLGYFYLSARLITPLDLPHPWSTVARICLAIMILIPFASIFMFNAMESWGRGWAWVVYLGLGFLSILLTTVLLRDIILVGWKAYELLAGVLGAGGSAATGDPSRRLFLTQATNVAALGAATILTGYGVYEARRRPGVVDIAVPIEGLPPEFDGFRIVQISDIHAGLTVTREWVSKVAETAAGLAPDLIAFTGDLADGSVPYLRDHVAPLAGLQAPHGKYFVTGNHEYYSGVEPWVAEASRMGYRVLLNEHEVISRGAASIVLAGITDPTGATFHPSHRPDPAKALEGAPEGNVKLLLAHQPKSLHYAVPLGFALQLSGHTHGGQFFPWNLVAALGQPYIAGLHKREGTWIYVSRGTGYWGPPVRLAARSEITVITLRRPSAAA